MTVSIVIPCFNHARFVGEAIASAIAQSAPPFEILVVNDGSTDGSGSVARRYSGVRVIDQANQGLSAGRNAGLAAARGDVVIFLDADDRLTPNAVEAATEGLRDRRTMMAFGRCVLIDERGCPMRTNLPSVRDNFYEELLRRNYIWTPGMAAFRRCVFDLVGNFDVEGSPAADYDLYLRIARWFPIAAHDTVVAEYRQHGANMSRDPVLMLEATLRVLDRQRNEAASLGLLRAYCEGQQGWREFYGDHLVQRFRSALRRKGGKWAAARDAAHLLRLYPRGVLWHLRRKAALLSGRAGDTGEGNRMTHVTRT
jgi:glycosyltransferase involved in cell wall biosynthesis